MLILSIHGRSFHFLESFLVFFLKHERLRTRFVYGVSLVFYFVLFMTMASRGAVFATCVSLMLFFMIKQGYKLSRFILIITLGILIFLFFGDYILFYVFDLLNSLDTHFYAIEKIARKVTDHDLSNGRASIIEDALTYFDNAPLFGQGVAIYEFFNHRYVHNIFIQVLIEGGLCLFVVISWFIIKSSILLFDKSLQKEQRYFIAFLIGSGLIELLFSNYLWRCQCFWFLVGYTMNFKIKCSQKN